MLRADGADVEISLPVEFRRTGWNRVLVFAMPLAVVTILVAIGHFNLSKTAPNFHVYDNVNALQKVILLLASLIVVFVCLMLLKFFISALADMRAQLFDGGARIEIAEDGMLDLRACREKILWQDVRSAKTLQHRRFKEVVLTLHSDASVKIRGLRVDMLAYNATFGRHFGRIVLVDVNAFDTDADIIAGVINSLVKRP
jgi:multisubunit Na+/H+ antiporter MnhB subunit